MRKRFVREIVVPNRKIGRLHGLNIKIYFTLFYYGSTYSLKNILMNEKMSIFSQFL